MIVLLKSMLRPIIQLEKSIFMYTYLLFYPGRGPVQLWKYSSFKLIYRFSDFTIYFWKVWNLDKN